MNKTLMRISVVGAILGIASLPIFLAYTIAKLHRAVEVVEVLKAQLDECRQGAGK